MWRAVLILVTCLGFSEENDIGRIVSDGLTVGIDAETIRKEGEAQRTKLIEVFYAEQAQLKQRILSGRDSERVPLAKMREIMALKIEILERLKDHFEPTFDYNMFGYPGNLTPVTPRFGKF